MDRPDPLVGLEAAENRTQAPASDADDATTLRGFTAVPRHLLSRLLYANPVCLLSVGGDDGLVTNSESVGEGQSRVSIDANHDKDDRTDDTTMNAMTDGDNDERSHVMEGGRRPRNTMVISWLSAIDNRGTFFMSMKRTRHSAALLTRDKFDCDSDGGVSGTDVDYRRFVLSIPTMDMAELVTRIGSCSGRDCGPGGKAHEVGYRWCHLHKAATNKLNNMLTPDPNDRGVAGCCAHLVCEVLDRWATEQETGHLKLLCRIGLGLVDPGYFSDGKTFHPPRGPHETPVASGGSGRGYMSFLGSKTFTETL